MERKRNKQTLKEAETETKRIREHRKRNIKGWKTRDGPEVRDPE